MSVTISEHNNVKIASISENIKINGLQDAVDLLGNADYLGADKIIVNEINLASDFFDLRTGIAGDILQKFANYHKKLAIIGNFSKYNSNALNAFIIECNRGSSIYFVNDFEEAIYKLT